MEDLLKNLLGNVVKSATSSTPVVPYAKPKNDATKKYLEDIARKAQERQAAARAKSPFLMNLGDDAAALIKNTASRADRFIADQARNVSDAATGKLAATPEDYGVGAVKVIKGIGRGAQMFNEGAISFGKSIQEGLVGKANMDRMETEGGPLTREFLKSIAGTEDVATAQDVIPVIEAYATSRGATANQAKVLGGLGFFGMMAANNPAFSPAKTGTKLLFEISDDSAKMIAKTEDNIIIRDVLISEGLDEDTATKLAPAFTYADKPAKVKGVVEDIKNGVRIAQEAATNDEVAGAKLRERGFGKSVADEAPEMGTVPEKYTQRNTDQLATKAQNLVRDDIIAAEARAASRDLSDDVVAISAELLKEYRRQSAAATDASVKAVFDKKYAELARESSRKLTEAGRYAQAASILRSETPEGKVRFAIRTIEENNAKKGGSRGKQKQLSEAEITDLRNKYADVEKMPEGNAKDRAWAKAEEELSVRVNPAPWYKKLTGLWKAGLLTGLKTTGLNVSSTAFNTGLEALSRIPATGADIVISLITKKRTVTLASEMSRKIGQLIKTGKADKEGFLEGTKKGFEYVKTGYDERRLRDFTQMGKIEYGNSPVGKLMTAYVDSVFKVTGAGDFPFFYGVRASSMLDQATAAAKNSGLKGAERKAFIDELLKSPTDEMIENATADAMIATFTNDTLIGRIGVKVQEFPLVGDIIVPFARTPGAVAMQVVNYTPAGVVAEAAKQITKGEFDQRKLSKAIGRGITGTGAMYLGYTAYQNGIVSLNYEEGERDNEQAKLEGRRPNAIRLGDRWYSAASFGPAGFQIILGGYLARGISETGSVVNAVAQTALGMGTLISEQSMMQGLQRFVQAIDDPKTFAGSYVESLLGSTIPTIVADVANALDPVERETPGILDTMVMRTPFLRETLAQRVDTLGAPVGLTKEEEQNAWVRGGDVAAAMLDFTRSTGAKTSPLIEEFKRLKEAGHSATPTKLGNKNGYDALSAHENYMLWRFTGDKVKWNLERLIQQPEYQDLDDDGKKKNIDNITEAAKNHARAEFVTYTTAGLGEAELKETLKAYVETGLLTKTVFKIWEDSLQ